MTCHLRGRIRLAFPFILCAAVSGCEAHTEPPDHTPPQVRISFPQERSYDRDHDGLVDLELAISDSGRGIDLGSLVVTTDRALGPEGSGGTDLMARFHVARLDTTTVVLEETTDHLLPSGPVTIRVVLRDQAGNFAGASATILLPEGAFHRRIEVGPVDRGAFRALGVEILPDGSQGFLLMDEPSGRAFPFDPHTLVTSTPIRAPRLPSLGDGEYSEEANRLFVASVEFSSIGVLDPSAPRFESTFRIPGRATGISASPSGRLYAALATLPASIAVIEPIRGQVRIIQTDRVDPLNPGEPAILGRPCVPPSEDVLYAPLRVEPGGLLVIDPSSGRVLDVIDFHPDPRLLGMGLECVFDPDRNRLYVTDYGGLSEVDLETRRLDRRIESTGLRTKFVSTSPSGRRLFVTTGSPSESRAENWLVDLDTFSILQRFSAGIPEASGDWRSAFRPDGQVVFVASGLGIATYLNRE